MNVKQIAKTIVPVRARQFIKDSIQLAVYATPDFPSEPMVLSQRAQSWYDTLRRDGLVRIDGETEFEAVANYVETSYFRQIEVNRDQFLGKQEPIFPFGDSGRFIFDHNRPLLQNAGTEVNCYISFSDENCAPLFLNKDIISIVYKYYGRQPYYRNQPLIQMVKTNSVTDPDAPPLNNGNFHVDHLHQVSFMLLVSDVTERDPHMQYCIGSNRRNLLLEGVEMSIDECKIKVGDYPVVKCIGKKGTLFVFDTSGIHRGTYMPDSIRKMMHLNITTGHNREKFIDQRKALSLPDSLPRYVKEMFHYLN